MIYLNTFKGEDVHSRSPAALGLSADGSHSVTFSGSSKLSFGSGITLTVSSSKSFITSKTMLHYYYYYY